MNKNLNAQHRRVATACTLFFVSMFGLAYAAVPFYDWFCRKTGFGGTPLVARSAPDHSIEKTINVRFDSNAATDLPWRFMPKQREMRVKLGEVVNAVYIAESLSGHETAGTALYNVTPELAGGYFNKLECFCFVRQVLKPHEKRELTVSFFIDPEVLKDKSLTTLDTITLSYTFYAKEAQLSQAAQPTIR